MMKKIGAVTMLVFFVGILGIACAGFIPSAEAAKAEVVMRVGHGAAPGSARDLGCREMERVIEEASNGRIDVQIYPASQLGSGTELIQGLQIGGMAECTLQPSSFLGGFQPLVTLMDIPYLMPNDYENLIAIEKGPAGQALMATMEKVGVKTLGIWHTGYKLFTANKPLNTIADFAGLKFRAMPSQILMAQYRTVGATPVNVDFSETYNALQTGAIDGQENPFDTTTDMNFHEVQRYATVSNHGVLDQFVMVGKAWFDKLPPELQEAVMKGVEAGAAVTVQKTHEAESVSRKKMMDAGVTIKELNEAEMKEWRAAFAPVRQVYIDNYGDEAKALLELFEAEIAKQ